MGQAYYDILGKGCVYSYDPVGNYERHEYRAGGSGAAMLQPLLESQVCRHGLDGSVVCEMITQ